MKSSNDVNREIYKPGIRIYYTGDMANIEDFGTITKFNEPTKYSPQTVDIKFDDGRFFPAIYLSNFMPGAGRRFWLAEDWERDRQEKLNMMQIRMQELRKPKQPS